MSALSIQPTYPIFTETDGQPLEDGYIWIGTANLDPEGNPISVFWDALLTQPAGQPIRTLNGYPSNNGTPARLYVNSDYSIRVMNKNGGVVYSAPSATERYSDIVVSGMNAVNVEYDPPFTGGVQTNVEAKLAQVVSVLDFGADPTGTTVCSDKIQAAIDALPSTGGAVYVPAGTYLATNIRVDGTGGGKSNIVIYGDGPSSIIYKPDPADLVTDAELKSNVLWALTGNGHQVQNLKVEGNFSRGGTEPPYCIKFQLGQTYGASGQVLSVSSTGGSSTGASNDLVYVVTSLGAGQTASSVNISVDAALGYVTNVTSQPFDERTGTGYMNAYNLDNDFAYRAGIYMNGQTAPMEKIVVENCEVTDAVAAGILIGSGPLFASEVYYGSEGARIIGNNAYSNGATNIGGGNKVRATISNNIVGYTTSSGIRCDEGSHQCVISGNVIDTANNLDANGGVSVYKSDYVTVTGNFIKGAIAGITYSSCDWGTVSGNTIYDCGVGIGYSQMDTGTITGNTIVDCYSDGIRVTSGSQVSVSSNAIQNPGGSGIELVSALAGSSLIGNQVINAELGGILLTDCDHAMLSSNVVRDSGTSGLNKPGIAVMGTSNNCVVSGNRCFDSRSAGSRTQDYGVFLDTTVTACIVTNNRLANNGVDAVNSIPATVLYAFNGDGSVGYVSSGTSINFLEVAGGANGLSSSPKIEATGATTDIDIRLIPKGAGLFRYGAHSALAGETVTGYVEIKDSSGTVRKLAVVS
jgi:parallel beta-helix repeat protein